MGCNSRLGDIHQCNCICSKMEMKSILSALLYLGLLSASYATLNLSVDGLQASMRNDYLEINFTSYAILSSLHVNGTNLGAKGVNSFYQDWSTGKQRYFNPSSIHIVEQTASRVHFYWLQEDENFFKAELHYIMENDLNGIYCYVKVVNDKNVSLGYGEMRTVYRFNGDIMTQGTNQARTGTVPNEKDFKNATEVQDATFKFQNGTYYTKYDFAEYIRKIDYKGVYGNGFGAFVISPSKEYHGGGPMKQDLTVHQLCLVSNYLMSGHFGTPAVHSEPGWTHIYGPFLIYFPIGDDETIISDVANQVVTEKSKWPYAFVKDDDYPLERGSVSGVVSGQKSATVVLWDSINEDFDRQQKGYLYSAETNSTGHYVIDKVRPGFYRIAAYPTAGLGSDSLDESNITIAAGRQDEVNFILNEPDNIMWSLGEANRLSSEFKYSDQPRNYKWMSLPPVNNTFYIGQSDPKEDWYYAQSKPGRWYIKYQDTRNGKSRTLRVALAAVSQKTHLQVFVNGHRVGDKYYENDQAIYRSAMQSGRYYSKVYPVSSAQIVNGENTVMLSISHGQIMYDTISMQRDD